MIQWDAGRKTRILNRLIVVFFLALAMTFQGCSLLQMIKENNREIGSGASIIRYGSYIYKIGGREEFGAASTRISMAKLELDGQGQAMPLVWSDTFPLPEGRAFAAAFAVNDYIYVLGGHNGFNLVDTVLYTRINSDGSLGFGSTGFWETSPGRLPNPRSHMAPVYHDGRLFLIGGKGIKTLKNSIIHARIYQNTGMPGTWYDSPQNLSSFRHGVGAAVVSNFLYVAGGMNTFKTYSDEMVRYELGLDGLLSNPTNFSLPEPLCYPVLDTSGDTLMLIGGFQEGGVTSSVIYTWNNMSWETDLHSVAAEGPSAAIAAGTFWLHHNGSVENVSFNAPPDKLSVFPSSGLVTRNAPIKIQPEPGTVIRYRKDLNNVGQSDLLYDPAKPPTITADATYSFKAFGAVSGLGGRQTSVAYRIRTSSFLVWIGGEFGIKEVPEELDTIYIRDNIFDPTTTARASSWGRFYIYGDQAVSLYFSDAITLMNDNPYTAKVRLSVFEEDLYTEALDIYGKAIRGLTSTGTDQPIKMDLRPGVYYIRLEDIEAIGGRSLGLSLVKR